MSENDTGQPNLCNLIVEDPNSSRVCWNASRAKSEPRGWQADYGRGSLNLTHSTNETLRSE